MRELIKNVNLILEDDKTGSINSLNELLISTSEFYKRNITQDIVLVNNILIDQLYKIYNKNLHFSSVFHFINELFNFIEYVNNDIKKIDDIIEFIANYSAYWSSSSKLIYNNLVNIYDINEKKILLHSNSFSVQTLLSEFKNNNIKVDIFQTVSNPDKEGMNQANNISDMGFDVTLIEDLSIASVIEDVNIVFLGADSIFNEYFIDKSGSKAISIICKNFSIPVFVICDSRKILTEKNLNKKIIDKYNFVNNKPLKNKNISNKIKYFNMNYEKISNLYISRFINEKGVFTPKNINTIANQLIISKHLI